MKPTAPIINSDPHGSLSAADIEAYMLSLRNDEQRTVLMRFFKTQRLTDYGYGDSFIGIKVPQTRQVVALSHDLPIDQIVLLLQSQWHEVRLCGFLLLAYHFDQQCRKKVIDTHDAVIRRDAIVSLYFEHADRANNWDLVDLSAPAVVGRWLTLPTLLQGGKAPAMATSYKQRILDRQAESNSLWRQRISMVSCWTPTRQGDPSWSLRYADKHISHPHDLMHKAVGWMLREVGKHCSRDVLRTFLTQHLSVIHPTTLRYAIEHLSEEERQQWMKNRRDSVRDCKA